MSNLPNKITAFLDRHAIEPTALGIAVSNDSHLILNILRGKRKPRRATVRKIEMYMRAYKPKKVRPIGKNVNGK